VCIDMVTVILSPMNPWIESDAIQERLLKYWESKPSPTANSVEQSYGQSYGQCPFQTLSIAVESKADRQLSATRN
jgi:hypothetical protein